MKNIIKISFFCFLFLLFFANQSFAQTSGCPTGLVPCGGQDCPCQFCHFFIMFDNIFNFVLFRIVPIVAALLIAIAGFMFIFGYADQQGATINKAKELFKAIIIGMVIIYCAWLIVHTFFFFIGEDLGLTGTWFKFQCSSSGPTNSNQQNQGQNGNQNGGQGEDDSGTIIIENPEDNTSHDYSECKKCGRGLGSCDQDECKKLAKGGCRFVRRSIKRVWRFSDYYFAGDCIPPDEEVACSSCGGGWYYYCEDFECASIGNCIFRPISTYEYDGAIFDLGECKSK